MALPELNTQASELRTPAPCPRCSRLNPAEAEYCYYDGSALGHSGSEPAPLKSGVKPFPHPFTFPSGHVCHHFNELALACQEHWPEAAELLRKGYLETFLGGLGRTDLAAVAHAAARCPDRDQGLQQLLGKLPTEVLEPPCLEVEPRQINLGQLRIGDDRRLLLHLHNGGMGLLTGAATLEPCDWLSLGAPASGDRHLFQFIHEAELALSIRGSRLRASQTPLEGQIFFDSNGGSVTCTIRALVPVQSFPEGVLVGASSPREVAQKARAQPHEAAPLFESGAVARWFVANGWTYPVQGPLASGAAAVQQFFDGLGFSKPSLVELNCQQVMLAATPGQELRSVVEITNVDKRPIYIQARSDQDWLQIADTTYRGRKAQISLSIPAVPDRVGETLHATVTIVANGKHLVPIPVALTIESGFCFDRMTPATPIHEPVAAIPPAPSVEKQTPAPRLTEKIRRWQDRRVLLSVAALLVASLGLLWWYRSQSGGMARRQDATALADNMAPRLIIKFNPQARFGILVAPEHGGAVPLEAKRLTGSEDGRTNNTCLRIDDSEQLFGQPPGHWGRDARGHSLALVPLGKDKRAWSSTWEDRSRQIEVRQTVELVRNDRGSAWDTCLVHYRIHNRDAQVHVVGLRFLLDTFIGSKDGMPFVLAGQSKSVSDIRDLKAGSVPEFVQSQENLSPTDPGTIVRLGLQTRGVKVAAEDPEVDDVERLVLCRWPGNPDIKWAWDFRPIDKFLAGEKADKDSCAVLYWAERPLPPDATRALAFTYGLADQPSSPSGGQ